MGSNPAKDARFFNNLPSMVALSAFNQEQGGAIMLPKCSTEGTTMSTLDSRLFTDRFKQFAALAFAILAFGWWYLNYQYVPITHYKEWRSAEAYLTLCHEGDIEGNASKLFDTLTKMNGVEQKKFLSDNDISWSTIAAFQATEVQKEAAHILTRLRDWPQYLKGEDLDLLHQLLADPRIPDGENSEVFLGLKPKELDEFENHWWFQWARDELVKARGGSYEDLSYLSGLLKKGEHGVEYQDIGTTPREIESLLHNYLVQMTLDDIRDTRGDPFFLAITLEDVDKLVAEKSLTLKELGMSAAKLRELKSEVAVAQAKYSLGFIRKGESGYLEKIRKDLKEGLITLKGIGSSEKELASFARRGIK